MGQSKSEVDQAAFSGILVQSTVDRRLASLSLFLDDTNAISKLSDILASASNLTNTGLLNPAFAKSTNDLGKVAENNKDCLEGGNAAINSFNCSANPISNNASASSNTMYSTVFKSRFISTFKCKKRPGVATTISGFDIIDPNWSSKESPPISKIDLKSVDLANSLNCLKVWIANSLEGDNITALTPIAAECTFNFSTNGNKNAAVLPEPVLAIPTTSLLDKIKGMVFL